MHHLAEHQLHYSITCVAYLPFALVVLDEQISPVFSNEPLPTVSVQPLPTSKKIRIQEYAAKEQFDSP